MVCLINEFVESVWYFVKSIDVRFVPIPNLRIKYSKVILYSCPVVVLALVWCIRSFNLAISCTVHSCLIPRPAYFIGLNTNALGKFRHIPMAGRA